MSYLVFARKWRPRDFDEVVGQEHITKTLKSAILANKIAHAYIFAGPQGVGKTSCARILAKALNCEKGPTAKPCGSCPACNEINEGQSLDVIEIDGASNRGIDEIRTLRENVKFAPLRGKNKIYIIDEVHMLTPEAFNALLKTLEEPPAFVKFIFATTQPQKVLPTILSRCQRFDFTRILNIRIIEKLKDICSQEKISIGDDVLFAIAKASDGSLRDAESILDQLISFSQKDVTLDDVVLVLGVIEQQAFLDFVDNFIAGEAGRAIELIAEVATRGKDLNYFLEGLLEHYRNLMVIKVVKSEAGALVDLPKDVLAKIVEQARQITISDILLSINQIFAAQDMAKKLNSPRIPLEILAVKLSSMGEKKLLAEPAGEAEPNKVSLEQKKPSYTETKKPFSILKEEKGVADNSLTSFSRETPACTLDDVKSKWDVLISNLSSVKMSVATYLRQATPMKLEHGTLTIGFPKEAVFFKEAMTDRDNLKVLSSGLDVLLTGVLKTEFVISDALNAPALETIETTVEKNPFLKVTLDLFQGKVVKRT
jgi:DNA polymerase-3 subunit gamma/tau